LKKSNHHQSLLSNYLLSTTINQIRIIIRFRLRIIEQPIDKKYMINNNRDVSDVCIPKLNKGEMEEIIRNIIEDTKIGEIIQYREKIWKYDQTKKRVIMRIAWNQEHAQYKDIKERLQTGKNVKIVKYPEIIHLFILQ